MSSKTTGKSKAPEGSAPDRAAECAPDQFLTTDQGVPIGDNQNSLKAGLRGPTALEDFIMREKITHFDHERIPERVVHARGSAAHGYFESYQNLSALTRAAPFAASGKRTPVFVRFSTVAGERGSADTARDPRGFAVKFYTDEGNWDLVGNNIPVFFIQDAIKFPDLIHAVKPQQNDGMPQAASAHDTFWDFASLSPETTHMLMWQMSDRAIPRSFRMMQGFGVHTFRLVNAAGEARFCKFHWTPLAGTHSLLWDEAVKLAGADADFHRRDLWQAIEAGAFPEWELGLQVFNDEQAAKMPFDILDPTKIVPQEMVPLTPVGRLVLDRNPDNFFAETEQVAYCAAHVVPGIDFSDDPLLQGRIFSYLDTQLSRLGGPNFHQLPINAPHVPVRNDQRDGMHQQSVPRGAVAYDPNSLGGGCPFQAGAAGFNSFPEAVSGSFVRAKPQLFAEHYAQATLFWNSQTPAEQRHIVAAFRFELTKVDSVAVRQRVVARLVNVDAGLAAAVADGLGFAVPEPLPGDDPQPAPQYAVSPSLSQTSMPGNGSIATLRVALLVDDGVDGELTEKLRAALKADGAVAQLVGRKLGLVEAAGGIELAVDISLDVAAPSTFDAVAIQGGAEFVALLARNGRVLEFVKEQYRHCKPILVQGEGLSLLEKAGIPLNLADGTPDSFLIGADGSHGQAALNAFKTALAQHKLLARETDPPRV